MADGITMTMPGPHMASLAYLWRQGPATAALDSAWRAFGDLVGELTEAECDAPTRCGGWVVRDVAAHVVGQAFDIAHGNPGTRSPAEQAAAHRGNHPSDLAGMLADSAARVLALLSSHTRGWDDPRRLIQGRTVAESVMVLAHDAIVHRDDILDALGRGPVPDADLLVCVAHLWHTLTRNDVEFAFDLPGIGIVAHRYPTEEAAPCPVRTFVLAATGRLNPAAIGAPPQLNVYGSPTPTSQVGVDER